MTLTLQRVPAAAPAADKRVMLMIEDDGKGYEPGDTREPVSGFPAFENGSPCSAVR